MLDFIYKGFVHNGTVQNETRQNEVRSQGPSTQVIEEQRKFAYSKAIEAYWKHIDRYHTWMNYYSLFNGALFVGFCTLLTATSNIHISDCHEITLSNQYESLQIFVCLLGLLSSICWLGSLIGHQKWEENWMNIVCKYEDTNHRIYSLLITNTEEIVPNNPKWEKEKLGIGQRYRYAFSTHSITKVFLVVLILSWIICLIFTISQSRIHLCEIIHFFCHHYCVCSFISVFLSLVIIVCIITFLSRYRLMFSNVEGKYWERKE